MTHETPFSSVPDERWIEISDFPGYMVSDWGRVLNASTGFHVKPTVNTKGLYMVGLMQAGIQRKRSLPLLVAREYVRRPNDEFDTPINLDGNRANNHYANIAWRPLWFARRYSKQFTDGHATIDVPIENIETREVYKNSMAASIACGVLDIDIVLSMHNNTYVWPLGQIFRESLEH